MEGNPIQQKRTKLLNLFIIISILVAILGTIIFCIISPHNNLFNVVVATSKDECQVNIIIDEYVGKAKKDENQFNFNTPLPDNSQWYGLVNKPAKYEEQEQSGKEIYFPKNSPNLFYAYRVTLKNNDKKDVMYNISVKGLENTQTKLMFGVWDKQGFSIKQSLNQGLITPKNKSECFIIITPSLPLNQIEKTISQNKSFKIEIISNYDNQDK